MLKRVMWAAIAVALSMPGAGISAAKAQDRDVKFVLDFISWAVTRRGTLRSARAISKRRG